MARAPRLTNPERVLFAGAGVTKADYAAYLAAAAPRMGRFVFNRPASLVRAPEGTSGQRFFQRHAAPGAPKAIAAIAIQEADGETKNYITLPNADALAACAQISALEIHPWAARNDNLERPDRLIFDLDPDEGLAFAAVKRAAFEIKALLDNADLPAFALITGGKGVHVVTPLQRRHGWEEAKRFARGLAERLVATAPDRYVAQAAKTKRAGRVFIDYLRNGRGATAIAPYSTRARASAPVAAPVSWDELRTLSAPACFTIKDMPARLAAPDPWARYGESAARLSKAVRAKLALD